MRIFFRTFIAIAAVSVLVTPAAAQLEVTGGTVAFSVGITEGVDAARVAIEWQKDGRTWRGTGARGLTVAIEQTPFEEGRVELRVSLRNTGDERRRLEFATLVAPELDDATARYWDGGFADARPIAGPQETDEPRERGAWPLSAVGDASGATFMGVTPDTLISFGEPTFVYAPDGESRYRFAVRSVVDPGQEERFGLIVGTTTNVRWGFLNAVWQAYHDAFPQHAAPAEGAPDAIWGTSAQYHAWWQGIDREELRRLGCTWDWCYAPFKRSGDFWGRDEEWTYEPLGKPFSERLRGILDGSYNMGEISAEQFRNEREAFFDEYGYDTGSLFYTPSGIWIEKQLAQEKFADALAVNDNMKTELSLWVTGYDDELLVQPTGTSYGERLNDDYRLIAQTLDVAGFAFDVCTAGQRNYSEAVQGPLPGRSWDERGVFFDLGISMAEQMQYIRGLDWGDAPFERGLIVGGGASFTSWHVDGALLELTLTGPQRHKWSSMCMSLGGKPRVIWKGYELRDVLQDTDGMPRADFLNVWAKLADYVNLKSFQWGMFPGYNYLPGMGKLQADLPLLRECVRAGWQPVCPVEHAGDGPLWIGRYGTGAQTLIAVGNPAEEAVAADLTLHNEPLGEVDCVFVDAKAPAEPLAQAVSGGETRLTLDCPRRRESVLRSVLGVRCDEALECAASAEEGLDRIVARVTLTAANAAQARFTIPQRRGFEIASVTLNGAACRAKGRLRAGENALEVTYASQHFGFDRAALDAFEFLTAEGEMAFTLVAPDPEERAGKRVAGRLDRYFRYYAQHALGVEEPATLTVATERPATGAAIVLRIGDGAAGNGWSLQDGALVLNAPDEQEAIRRTDELLAALDRRYEYTIPFLPVYGMAGRHLTARKLYGLTMTEALAQEGQTW